MDRGIDITGTGVDAGIVSARALISLNLQACTLQGVSALPNAPSGDFPVESIGSMCAQCFNGYLLGLQYDSCTRTVSAVQDSPSREYWQRVCSMLLL
jgi:hypothetical protein